MGYFAIVVMLVLSVMYFSDLGYQKVLIYNAVFFGLFFLPFLGIPGWIAIIGQFITLASFYASAKMA